MKNIAANAAIQLQIGRRTNKIYANPLRNGESGNGRECSDSGHERGGRADDGTIRGAASKPLHVLKKGATKPRDDPGSAAQFPARLGIVRRTRLGGAEAPTSEAATVAAWGRREAAHRSICTARRL